MSNKPVESFYDDQVISKLEESVLLGTCTMKEAMELAYISGRAEATVKSSKMIHDMTLKLLDAKGVHE